MTDDTSPRRERLAAVLIAAHALATMIALGEWLFRRWDAGHVTWIEVPFWLLNIPVSHSLISASLLLLLTAGLLGRKRLALYVALVLQVAGIYVGVAGLVVGSGTRPGPSWAAHTSAGAALDAASAVIGVVLVGVLWWLRPSFPARVRPGSWVRAITVLVGGLAGSVVLTTVLLTITEPGSGLVSWQVVARALGRSLGDPDLIDTDGLNDIPGWIPEVTSLLVSATLLVAVWVFTRSARQATAWTPERELAVRELIARNQDADSLDYFATRRDKATIFSPAGGAVVAYRVLHGVSLAAGDPLGNPHEWSQAIAAWKREARQYGWVPAVLGASERGARAYAAAGLAPINIGDEAILDPDRFGLDSPAMTPVRHAVKRAQRAGLTVTFRRQEEIGAGEVDELDRAAEAWRGNEPERGFSMALNRQGDPADFDMLVATVRDDSQRLMAVLTFVPWGRAGRSLDLMRRRPDAPNGTVELVVSELVRNAATLGVRQVSLNFCMFRSVYADAARLSAGALTRLNYSVLGRLDRLWQLERLYRSNQKYDPEWRPRYLCHDSRVGLPLVAIAAGVAEGFLPDVSRHDEHPEGLDAAGVAAVRALAEQAATPAPPRRNDQQRVRLTHVEYLRAAGREPWPVAGPADRPDPDTLTGRVVTVRDLGGVVFADVLTDRQQHRQVLLEAAVPLAEHTEFSRLVDSGDLVRFTGVAGASRSGEPSLLVDSWELLAKSLHPLVLGRRDLSRRRVTDLITTSGRADLIRKRSTVVRALRECLTTEGYLEVETPMLNAVHGGATARPFRTRSNAYGVGLSLRIAPELYLKRLVVAGIGAVFELGRNFRNEGADATHNPEFTSLEAYRPGGDYTTMRQLAERLVRQATCAVHGGPLLPLPGPDGEPVLTDVSEPWPVVPVLDAVSEAVGVEVTLGMDYDQLLGVARSHGVSVPAGGGVGSLVEALYGDVVEPATVLPTFYTDFPQETSPLTRPHRSEPGLVERWDLVIGGMELGTAYSELTDPLDQRDRLVAQSFRAAAGDVEAMEVDEEFLYDLELGMPPTGGLGLGVDRIAMAILGVPIREVLAFPFVKPLRDE